MTCFGIWPAQAYGLQSPDYTEQMVLRDFAADAKVGDQAIAWGRTESDNVSVSWRVDRWRICIAAALCLGLFAACATMYEENTKGFGWTVTALSVDEYLVNYNGTASMTESKVHELAILRSCEVALERSFAYFEILSAETIEVEDNIVVESPSRAIAQSIRLGPNPPPTGGSPLSVEVSGWSTTLHIRLVHDRSPVSVTAASTAETLRESYGL